MYACRALALPGSPLTSQRPACRSGPFGSHVLEKALVAVAAGAAFADEAGYAVAAAALGAATDAAAANLYAMITSKYGSFVARRLLCVLCGRDVSAPPQKRQAAPPPDADGAAPAGPAGKQGAKLSGRVGGTDAGAAAPPSDAPFPDLLSRLAAAALHDEWGGHEVASLQCDPFAGPFLQSLLRACAHDTDQARAALAVHCLGGNPAAGADSVTPDALNRLLTDRAGSHLMEAVFETAPDEVFNKLCTAAFRGRLVPLAQHPSANFAVQAALAALRRPQQLKRMFEDLRPALAALLRARRGGVVTVLLAAAGRLQTLEADCASALWHAAEAGLGGAGGGATPLHSLLTLDTTAVLGEAGGGVRLSSLGCAALVSVLRYPAAASKAWADALAALPGAELASVARDPGGCRVIETYLEGPGAAPKKRRRCLQALAGSWAAAAGTGAGCRFVENCFALAEPGEKEAITAELAVAEQRLAGSYRGAGLLRACQVAAYKAGDGDWQRRVAAAEVARREFEDIFADDKDKDEPAGAAAQAPAGGDAGGDDDDDDAAQRKAQRKADKMARKAAAAAAADGEHAAAPAAADKSTKRKSKKTSGDQAAADAVDAVLELIGAP